MKSENETKKQTNKQNNFIEAEGNCLTGLLMQFVYLVNAAFCFAQLEINATNN